MAQTDILRVFISAIVKKKLHIVEPIGPMSKLVAIRQSSAHFPAKTV